MSTTPAQLQEKINLVSDEFYAKSQELADIAERKGTVMLDLIKEHKTRAAAEIYWDATPDGRRESYLKIYLRGLQAKRGAMVLEHKSNMGNLY